MLAFLKCDPEIEGRQPPRRELIIEMTHGFPSLVLSPGTTIGGSGDYLLGQLHGLLFGWRQEELPGTPIADCATVTTEAGHILLLGEKGQGKTTLLLYLMALGWPVAGWQHLFLSGQQALPNPLPLRVPIGILNHLPSESAAIVRALPSITTLEGSPIYAVGPTAFGHPWKIRSRPVRQVVFVSGNQGGRSRLQRMDWETAMQRVLKGAMLPPTNKASALANIGAMISNAECLELWNGTVEESRRLLEKLLH
jgi:energy-coupling factor transporter ATP-binding protein EcfA2